jgi:hypothetical protein
MRKIIIATALSVASALAFGQTLGQLGQASPGSAQATAGGVNIQGNTNINAAVRSQTAVGAGIGNTAKNTVGAIKGGTNIKGNTKINAVAGNQTAVAAGIGNKAENAVGQIGGN